MRARHLKVSVMHEILRCGNVWRMMTKLGTVRTYCLCVCDTLIVNHEKTSPGTAREDRDGTSNALP